MAQGIGMPYAQVGAMAEHLADHALILASLGGLRRLASLKMLTARSLRQGVSPIVTAVIGPMSRGAATLSENGSPSSELSALSVGD